MIDDDSIKSIERLHRLKAEGVISEEEFERSKEKILFGQRPKKTITAPATFDGELPPADDYIAWAILPLRRYADFKGRSNRKEYWLFFALNVAAFIALVIISAAAATGAAENGFALFVLGLLALVVPNLAVQVRRFHDQDLSGLFALLNLIPYLGTLVILVFMLIEGTRGDNRFGPDPRNGQ